MSYTNAIYYCDPISGSDTARTALTTCVASNPSGTITRIAKTAHGLVTGAIVDLTLFTTWLNARWKITVVDANNFDLDAAVWQATADANGTVTPLGGSSKADAWKTGDGGDSSRVIGGDTVRIIASPDPTLVGNATWTNDSKTVTLAAAVNTDINDCESPWVASANVTSAVDGAASSFKRGNKSAKLTFAAGFTTGLAAYQPVFSMGAGAIANRAVNLLGAAALTQVVSATADDVVLTITLPFNVVYNGSSYDKVTICSNSWLAFGTVASSIASNPAAPAIQIGARDNSWQRVYHGAENGGTTYRIRFEGRNATTGTPGSPNIVWEIAFDQAAPGTVKIDIDSNTYGASPVSLCSDGSGNTVYSFASGASNTGYSITQSVSVLDLSAYQQVSLWMQASTTQAAGTMSVKLCTDTVGAVPVHTIPLPQVYASTQWQPVVVDLGGAMNSAIQSIALYCDIDPATASVWLDNIVACKASSSADGLTHHSLIGKAHNLYWAASTVHAANTIRKPTAANRNGYAYKVTAGGGGSSGATEPTWPNYLGAVVADGALTWTCTELEETWYAIQSINGATLKIDGGSLSDANSLQVYSGATETVATYKREPLLATPGTAFSTISCLGNLGSNGTWAGGTVGTYVKFVGGWNRTDMTTQSGETWISGNNGNGSMLTKSNGGMFEFAHLNGVRMRQGISLSSNAVNYRFVMCHMNHMANSGINASAISVLYTEGCRTDCNSSGAAFYGASTHWTGNALSSCGNAVSPYGGFMPTRNYMRLRDVVAKNNKNGFGVAAVSGTDPLTDGRIINLVTAGNSSGGVDGNSNVGDLWLLNPSLAEAINVSMSSTVSAQYQKVIVQGLNGDANDNRVIYPGGSLRSVTDVRHTASGLAWRFNPTAISGFSGYTLTQQHPLILSLAKIACAANVTVSVRVWTRRDSTNIKGQLFIGGGTIAGVPIDQTVACEPTINTWVQSSPLTFTPTVDGVVEIEMRVWDGVGSANNYWVDDMTVTS